MLSCTGTLWYFYYGSRADLPSRDEPQTCIIDSARGAVRYPSPSYPRELSLAFPRDWELTSFSVGKREPTPGDAAGTVPARATLKIGHI